MSKFSLPKSVKHTVFSIGILTLVVVFFSAATQEANGGYGGVERGSRGQNEERKEAAGTVGTALITQPRFVKFFIRSEINLCFVLTTTVTRSLDYLNTMF
jgi:hypothetical protein